MVHDGDKDSVRDHAKRVLSGEVGAPIEHRIIHKNGAIRWVRNTGVPRFDNDGCLIAYDGLITDITERKTAEDTIVRAKKEWEDTFDAIAEIIFIADRDHKIVRANKAHKEITGLYNADFVGRPYYEVFPRMNHPHEISLKAIETGRVEEVEIAMAPLGKIFHIKTYPSRDSEGAYLFSVHVMEDITERKQAEEVLRRYSAKLEEEVRKRTEDGDSGKRIPRKKHD